MDSAAASFNGDIYIPVPVTQPYNTPALKADLVLRVIFAILGNLVCLVPLRLLYRNGEFAAALLILVVEVRNVQAVLYALIWQNNDMKSWWPGYGLCDIHPFIYNASVGLYVTCIFAIMRNLAHQVGLLRVNPLSVKERRRKNIIQALIIFPLPIIQMALTWPHTSQRYIIAPVTGCIWNPYPTWPFLVFFVIIHMGVCIGASVYAVIIYFRFRQVSKTTASALSSNQSATSRSQRTKRRLYLMVLSILVPFLPIYMALAILNIVKMGTPLPFDYNTIHRTPGTLANLFSPVPWNAVVFLPSTEIEFTMMDDAWICIITTLPIFLFFGMTKDAVNDYRKMCLFFGAGRLWPSLHEEYDPDRKKSKENGSSFTLSHSGTGSSSTKVSKTWKISQLFKSKSSTGLSTSSSSSGDTAADTASAPSLSFLTSTHLESGQFTLPPRE